MRKIALILQKNESYFNLKQLVQATHGSHESKTRHVGDFGNIEANGDGVATIDVEVDNTEEMKTHFFRKKTFEARVLENIESCRSS